MSRCVDYETRDNVAWITMNRPEVLNALNGDMADDLADALEEAEADASVRCVVLRGAGGHFMAGGDLKLFHGELDRPPRERRRHFEPFVGRFHVCVRALRRMPKPVIASVAGASVGGGFSLMLACDLVIAADDSYYTLAYSLIGTSPDGSSTWSLPRTVGVKKAMELALFADQFDAETALSLGLINRVVPAASLDDETGAWATRLAAGPTHAYANTKRLMYESIQPTLDTQLQAEAELFADCAASHDFAEGIRAFVEKRKATFTGE